MVLNMDEIGLRTSSNKLLKILWTYDKKQIGVESHKSYAYFKNALKTNLIFLSIVPHTSYKLQIVDVSVYISFKNFSESTFWQNN